MVKTVVILSIALLVSVLGLFFKDQLLGRVFWVYLHLCLSLLFGGVLLFFVPEHIQKYRTKNRAQSTKTNPSQPVFYTTSYLSGYLALGLAVLAIITGVDWFLRFSPPTWVQAAHLWSGLAFFLLLLCHGLFKKPKGTR